MSSNLWTEVEVLFAGALELPEADREAFVRARARSEEVAQEALSLLAAHLRSSVFDALTAGQDAVEAERDLHSAEQMAWAARVREALADRYQCDRELGRGGMAVVYQALDLRHDRKVAVKVLKPELAAAIGSERFLREIRVTANLQHPHILALFDSGSVAGFLFYVTPYVEGESLRDRLNRDRQVPVDEAVTIATQVAAALDYAHRQRVIHRDVKPENILLHDGQALVADFGIALAVSEAGGSRLTEGSVSVGTPQYMSPEQATGDRPLDARSDVYSLGVVLYEMLAGEPPYSGPTVQTIMARVLTDDPPPLMRHRRTVPPHVAASVHKALEKLPADRFSSAEQLAEALTNPSFSAPIGGRASMALRRWMWPVAAAIALAAAVFAWRRGGERRVPLERQTIVLGPVGASPASVLLGTAIAPDGSAIVFVDSSESGSQLWIKERQRLDPTPLRGGGGATGGVTFSPDGEWIAFEAGGQLRKVPRRGGVSVTLSDSAGGGRPAWLTDGTIVFIGPSDRALYRVSSDGGVSQRLWLDDQVDRALVQLNPLPDARGVLITAIAPSFEEGDVMVVDLASSKLTILVAGAGWGVYAPTGHLVYALRDGSLWAAAIDLEHYTLGAAIPLTDGVRTIVGLGEAVMGADGTLLYVRGREAATSAQLVVVNRAGQATPVDSGFALPRIPFNGSLSLSPDGRRLAMTLPREGGDAREPNDDIYVKRFPVGPALRLTFEGTSNRRPSWSSNGTRLLFISNRGGAGDNVWTKRADGGGQASLVADARRSIFEVESTRDGRWLIYRTDDERPEMGRGDIVAIRVGGDTVPVPLVATAAEETSPTVSWDSRWLAYASDETGRKEIYVRRFPDTADGKWLVSTGGGTEPAWARSGRELFYRDGTGNMVVAKVAPGRQSFEVLERRVLFDARRYIGDDDHRFYDVTPDGQQFIMISFGTAGAPGDLVMVSNFHEVLRRVRP